MKKPRIIAGIGASATIGLMALSAPAQATVSISYFSDFSDTGSGVSVVGAPYATATAPTIQLGDLQPDSAINTAALWPGAATLFAAYIDEVVNAPTAGSYTFTMESDDASYLFANGVLSLSNGGAHSENTVSGPVSLNAGLNTIQVQYDNVFCCGAGVQLTGLSPVPEPATWAMMLFGFGGLGVAMRSFRKETAVA